MNLKSVTNHTIVMIFTQILSEILVDFVLNLET